MQDILERARTKTDQNGGEPVVSTELRGIDRVPVKLFTDRDIRIRLYQQAQAIFHKDVPWVPLAHAQRILVIDRRVKNLRLSPIGWKYIRSASLELE